MQQLNKYRALVLAMTVFLVVSITIATTGFTWVGDESEYGSNYVDDRNWASASFQSFDGDEGYYDYMTTTSDIGGNWYYSGMEQNSWSDDDKGWGYFVSDWFQPYISGNYKIQMWVSGNGGLESACQLGSYFEVGYLTLQENGNPVLNLTLGTPRMVVDADDNSVAGETISYWDNDIKLETGDRTLSSSKQYRIVIDFTIQANGDNGWLNGKEFVDFYDGTHNQGPSTRNHFQFKAFKLTIVS